MTWWDDALGMPLATFEDADEVSPIFADGMGIFGAPATEVLGMVEDGEVTAIGLMSRQALNESEATQ